MENKYWDELVKEIKSQPTFTEAKIIIDRAVNQLDKAFARIKPEYSYLLSCRMKLSRVNRWWEDKNGGGIKDSNNFSGE